MPDSWDALDAALGKVVGVAPRQKFLGLTDLLRFEEEKAAGLTFLDVVTPSRAFRDRWTVDAHVVPYYVTNREGRPEEGYPRVNKKGPALSQIRQAGGDVKAWCMIWELDSQHLFPEEGKVPVSERLVNEFWTRVAAAPILEWVMRFTYFYTTKRGLRLVYVLKDPMSVDRMEGLHKFLTRQLHGCNVPVDESCDDWTRLFRLGRVRRDDKGTIEDLGGPDGPYWWEEILQADERFDAAKLLGSACLTVPPAPKKELDLPMPDRGEVHRLIGIDGKRPAWWAAVERDLRVKLCWTTIYKGTPIPEGHRMDSLQRFAGEVCRAIGRADPAHHLGPSHAFAMLLAPVEQLEPDADTEDWVAELWKACLRYWARDMEDRERKVAEAEAQVQIAESIQDSIIRGMRTWCHHPDLRADDATAAGWVQSRLIVATPKGALFVMKPDGFYDSIPVNSTLLKARIRELNMAQVIPLGCEDEKGRFKAYSPTGIIDRHATIVREIEGHGGGPGNRVENLGTENAKLILRLYRRRSDLTPCFDRDVDEWLDVVHGPDPDQIRLAKGAIGYSLDFEGGAMAAQAWIGARGVGKKMIIEGFAEGLDTGIVADTKDMDRFADFLWYSPYIIVNEGLPQAKPGRMDTADQFRLLTAGDRLSMEKKFLDRVVIRTALRMLIFANNQDLLTQLAGANRNLSQDDKLALAQRLIVYRVNRTAESWLRMKGGHKHTSGWIAGDTGGASDFRVARHFLWLYENRPDVQFGNRFLVEGNAEDSVVSNLSTRSGQAPAVIETLVAMIERYIEGQAIEGLHLDKDDKDRVRAWATPHAVCAWQRSHQETQAKVVTEREVVKVYRGIGPRNAESFGEARLFETRTGPRRANWWLLDLRLLLQESYDLGYRNGNLEALLKEETPQLLRLQETA